MYCYGCSSNLPRSRVILEIFVTAHITPQTSICTLAEAHTLQERVLALIRCELQSIMGGTGEAMGVLVYEWRSLSADGRTYILGLRDTYEQIWLDVLEEARAAGYFKADPFIIRRFLTGALSWSTTWFRPEGPMSLDQLAHEALSLVIKDH